MEASIAAAFIGLLAWDAWRRYLARHRVDVLARLEDLALAERTMEMHRGKMVELASDASELRAKMLELSNRVTLGRGR